MAVRGQELEAEVYQAEHIEQVLAEMAQNFPRYFEGFAQQPLTPLFEQQIAAYEKLRQKYSAYLDLEALDEFEADPNAFKRHTRNDCPIIHYALMSTDEAMKDYQYQFSMRSGRELLDAVRNIAEFGLSYAAHFQDDVHEAVGYYCDLGLEPLDEGRYGCLGVIGYGVQSNMLYGRYARCFAHRTQAAVWAFYFLSGRKTFGLLDGSEFLMANPNTGVCEQNYFYPAELFGFYSLKVYMMLRSACRAQGVVLQDHYRYVYLSGFSDYIAEVHAEDINVLKRSSEYVESRPWF